MSPSRSRGAGAAVKLLGVAAALLAAAPIAPAGGAARAGEEAGPAWWDAKWSERRTFECTGTRSDLAGDEVGVVEFLTGGAAAADGRDLRVIPRGGRPQPLKVFSTGPGDLLRVCFPLVKEVTVYDVYCGNPEARAGESFEPRRGLLLEVRGYREGQPDGLRGMLEIIKKSGPLQGADFVDRVFLGYNPFGPQTRYVSVYTGWLKCPADGEHVFATSSRDASFLLVDGKLVVQWPGWHGAVADVRFKGKATLAAGLHKLEYYHLNGEGEGIAVAAWQPPGAEKVEVIPAEAFARVSRGRMTAWARRSGEAAFDFEAHSAGEHYFDSEGYLVRAALSARAWSGGEAPGRRFTWSFGDGQSGAGASVEHVYVLPGVYRVKLAVEWPGGRSEFASAVRIDRDMGRALAGKSEPREGYLAAVAGYDLAKLNPAALSALARFYREAERKDLELAAARAILARPAGDFSDDDYFDRLVLAVHELRGAERGAAGRAEALELLKNAEERFKDPRKQGLRAKVIRERGDLYYFFAGDLDAAYNEYDKVVSRFRGLDDNIVRITKIRLGDIHRERGERAEAERRYREAEELKLSRIKPQAEEARRGALAHVAETYLRQRNLEECESALNIWEWEYPLEKLSGYSTLVRARLELARKKPAEVIKQVETLLKVNPESAYAGELLMAEYQAQRQAGATKDAEACLRRIVEKYPESAQAAEAKKLLEKAAPAPGPGTPKPPAGK